MASISAPIHAHLVTPSAAPQSASSSFKFQTCGRGRLSLPISISSLKAEEYPLIFIKHKQQHIQKLKVSAISEPSSSSSSNSLEPDYLVLAATYGESVKIVKIDTDDEYELARQLEIRGLPTIIFISPDSKKHAVRIEGLLPNETIKTIIENEL